jgi:hypothetical protein
MNPASTCGLHIHVSRDALTVMQIGKIREFLYNPENRKFIAKIAGRDNSSYARIEKTVSITDVAPENYSAEHQERYDAVNLRNQHTIEFRLFASTNTYNILMHRLDFVKALIDFTKPCAVSVKNLSDIKKLDVFTEFLNQNKKEYPFLSQFLGMKPIPPTLQEIQDRKAMKTQLINKESK